MSQCNEALLKCFLEFHVPLQFMELRRRELEPFSEAYNRELKECGDVIAHEGDTVLYRTKETGKNISKLTKGIALMVLAGNDLEFMGLEFKNTPETILGITITETETETEF